MVLCSWAGRAHAGGTHEPLQCPGPSPGPKGSEQMDSIKEDMCVVPALYVWTADTSTVRPDC